jgi:hypothetical protein
MRMPRRISIAAKSGRPEEEALSGAKKAAEAIKFIL